MVNAPERIWIEPHTLSAYRKPCDQDVEYVRADLHAALEAENARFRSGLQKLATSFYKSDQYQDYAKHVLVYRPVHARTEASATVKGEAPVDGDAEKVSRLLGTGIDGQVVVAAMEDAEYGENPYWLWRNHATNAVGFGRWSKVNGQAPYIRADLAIRAILSALSPAPQEAEAVAWRYKLLGNEPGWTVTDRRPTGAIVEPLYTHPPASAVTEAVEELRRALEFFDKTSASSDAEKIAVGHDHWDWVLSASRKVAALQAAQKVKP